MLLAILSVIFLLVVVLAPLVGAHYQRRQLSVDVNPCDHGCHEWVPYLDPQVYGSHSHDGALQSFTLATTGILHRRAEALPAPYLNKMSRDAIEWAACPGVFLVGIRNYENLVDKICAKCKKPQFVITDMLHKDLSIREARFKLETQQVGLADKYLKAQE